MKVLVIFGTRPETIKMAPVVIELQRRLGIETVVCVTGQHRGMLDEALAAFGIKPDYDLAIMRPGQTLADITTDVLTKLPPLLINLRPSRVLGMSRAVLKFARQASLVDQAMRPWRAVQDQSC